MICYTVLTGLAMDTVVAPCLRPLLDAEKACSSELTGPRDSNVWLVSSRIFGRDDRETATEQESKPESPMLRDFADHFTFTRRSAW